MIRLVLADDQSMVLAGLRTILEAEADIEVVGEARRGDEAVELARRLRPDLVLMDIRMPSRTVGRPTADIPIAGDRRPGFNHPPD